MSIEPIFHRSIKDLTALLPQLATLSPQLENVAQAMKSCWDHKGKILIAGNGGSASDAMHFAEELVARFQKNRRALAAIALCDPTVITCTANDFGFDQIFSRQLEALANQGDLFICLSTSGNSPNILRALTTAKTLNLTTVAFLGNDGGQCKALADTQLIVPATSSALIQAAHQLFYHTLCEWVDSQYS